MERAKKPSAIPVSPTLPVPQVSISDDQSTVSASLPTGESVQVLLHGATVISWKSAAGEEHLFLSSKAKLDGSKAVRGGIPLVFPVFGPPPQSHATTGLPQHGFARNVKWEYLGKSSSESSSLPKKGGDGSVTLDFGLSNEMLAAQGIDIPASEWKGNKFGITYSVTLSRDDLQTSLVIRNTGASTWEFQTLLHTYFAINDISKASVTGLESSSYKDKVTGGSSNSASNQPITIGGEVDRVYSAESTSQSIVITESKEPKYEITRDELSDVVVWNPWTEKAAAMSDFGPADAWKKMLCVEAGSVSKWISLEGGDAWQGSQRIRLL